MPSLVSSSLNPKSASIDIDERKCPEPPSSHPPEPSTTLMDQTSLGSGHRHHNAMDGMQDDARGPSDDSEMAVSLLLSAPCSPLYIPTTPYQPTTPEVEAMVLARTTSVETVISPSHFPPSPSFSLSSPVYASSSVYQTEPRARLSEPVVSHWMSALDDHDALKGLPPILSKRPSSVEVHNSGRSTEGPHPAIIPPNDAPSSFGQIRHPSSLVSLADLSRLTIKKPRYENIPADEGNSGKAERSVAGRRRARSFPNDQPKQWKLTSPRSGSKFEVRHGQVQDSDLSSSNSLSPSLSRSTCSLQCDRDQEVAPLVMTPNTDSLTRILVACNKAKCQLHLATQELTELEKIIVSVIEQRALN